MSRDQIHQPLILPHSGCVLPTSGLNIYPSYQSPSALSPNFSYVSPQTVFSSPYVASSNPSTDLFLRYTPTSCVPSSPTSLSSETSNIDKCFRIITWEELKTLLPEPGPIKCVESGLLSDGRTYAQKTARRDNYFLFPSKSAYILYFIHYYFSHENLDRDQTIRRMMIRNIAVSVENLIKAPRLASIETTSSDLEVAISNSNILCLVELPDGNLGVKRIDGYPGDHSSLSEPAYKNLKLYKNSETNLNQSSVQQNQIQAKTMVHELNTGTSKFTESSTIQNVNNDSTLGLEFSDVLTSRFNDSNLDNCQKDSNVIVTEKESTNTPSPFTTSSLQLTKQATSLSNQVSNCYLLPAVDQPQTVLQNYASDYSSPSVFHHQVPSHHINRSNQPVTSIGEAMTAAVAAMSIGGNNNGGVVKALSSGIGDRQNVNCQNNQLHQKLQTQYRPNNMELKLPSSVHHNSQAVAAAVAAVQQQQVAAAAAFAAVAQYQQQGAVNMPSNPNFYTHLHPYQQQLVRQNTPSPNQSFYHFPNHSCSQQQPLPAFYSFTEPPGSLSYNGFPLITANLDGYTNFRGSFSPQHIMSESNVWDTSNALAAATGIHLQYASNMQSPLIGNIPVAFDQFAVHPLRTPIFWNPLNNQSVPTMQTIKTQSVGDLVSNSSTSLSLGKLGDTKTCLLDDHQVSPVENAEEFLSLPNKSHNYLDIHSSRSSKGKYKSQQKTLILKETSTPIAAMSVNSISPPTDSLPALFKNKLHFAKNHTPEPIYQCKEVNQKTDVK